MLMPTYEYRCTACQHLFEEFQSIMDKPLKKCPQCGGRIKRLIGCGAGIIFKGSGFYQTDYRSSSYQAGAKSDSGSSKKDTSSTGSASPAASPPPAAPSAPAKAAE